MSNPGKNLWQGMDSAAQKLPKERDYKQGSLAQRLARSGVDASELAGADRNKADLSKTWIPGVEIFSRNVYPQHYRGICGELARQKEGMLGQIGLWPVQWATARMFAQTAKGF